MGKRIDFPHNKKVYTKKIVNLIQNNQIEKALNLIQELYKKENNFDNNYLYVYLLTNLNRYEEAYEIAELFEKDYVKNSITYKLYIQLLIKTHRFIKAEYFINQPTVPDVLEEKNYRELQTELDKEKVKAKNDLENTKEKIKQRLFQIENYSVIEQQEIISEAKILNLSTLQNKANYIFRNPNITPQIKKGYLELLIMKNDSNKYIFDWFNNSLEVCPAQLKTFDEVLQTLNIEQVLLNKLEKNPSLLNGIKTEIINDLLFIYPFVEETITNLNFWIDQYIKYFDPSYFQINSENISTEERENMLKWIEKMHLLSHRI